MTPPIARATIVPQTSAAQSGRLRKSDGRSGELRLQRPQDGASSHGQAQLLARARRLSRALDPADLVRDSGD
jgi:hypothetical protein